MRASPMQNVWWIAQRTSQSLTIRSFPGLLFDSQDACHSIVLLFGTIVERTREGLAIDRYHNCKILHFNQASRLGNIAGASVF